MADLFKEIIPSITTTGENLIEQNGNVDGYVPFIVNRALSAYGDCVMFANDMNMYHQLPKEIQYKYLYTCINKYRRPFVPWLKTVKDDRIEAIQRYCNCSEKLAKEYLSSLSEEEINDILKEVDLGGIEK